jgi:hypothetical protein
LALALATSDLAPGANRGDLGYLALSRPGARDAKYDVRVAGGCKLIISKLDGSLVAVDFSIPM